MIECGSKGEEIDLTDDLKETYIETAKQLKGSERRKFMARIVKSLGYGGQRQTERDLERCTIIREHQGDE